MFKELVIAAISGEEINLKARTQVKRAGGIDALTEEQAAKICKLCHIEAQETQETAYERAKALMDTIAYWKRMRAGIGEAHDFGEMAGYDATGDAETLSRCNAEIGKAFDDLESVWEQASREAKLKGGKVWQDWKKPEKEHAEK